MSLRRAGVAGAISLAFALCVAALSSNGRTVEATPLTAQAELPHRREPVAAFLAARHQRPLVAVRVAVAEAFTAARQTGMDPLLVLAVMSEESGLDPEAPSPGDPAGLMRVDPKRHGDRLAQHAAELGSLDPRVNTRLGTRILADYVRDLGGEAAALRRYGGSNDATETGYARRVLSLRDRLHQVAR